MSGFWRPSISCVDGLIDHIWKWDMAVLPHIWREGAYYLGSLKKTLWVDGIMVSPCI